MGQMLNLQNERILHMHFLIHVGEALADWNVEGIAAVEVGAG